jgi:PQQ enzyme repeat
MSGYFYRLLCAAALAGVTGPAWAANVVTYHYDNLRTGWNQAETTLTADNVGGGGFGLQHQVPLDEQVDAQPLFVAGMTLSGVPGTHDVVYVATENNTIYAIDANSGEVLLSQNYGPPVPVSALPGGCSNNSNNMGINSTPVIDTAAGLLYAIAYTYESNVPTFRIHAVNLTNLQDSVPPPVIGGSADLKNHRPLSFIGANNRQRAALIETGGKIYAGFASWCDINSNVSRGWVLGWNTGTLTQAVPQMLLNQRPTSPDNFYLSSVWMSGYGIASDDAGSLFFITGNSDYSGTTYNATYNLAESVVRLSTDLTTVQGFFTPNGGNDGWRNLDHYDADFGSAGVLLLPPQPGAYPNLAVAGGKAGPLYLLNRDSLGGLGNAHVTLGSYNNNGCWCGPSYFVGPDGTPRIVESTGDSLDIWKLKTTPATKLAYEYGNNVPGGQDPGFFTTISSNGTKPGSHVIWAVARPTNTDPADIMLVAFDPSNHAAQLFSAVAGTWPFAGSANANLVPVVANGHVFVASYANLSIFGLTSGGAKVAFHAPPRPQMPPFAGAPHELFGVVTSIDGDDLSLRTRTGTLVHVNVAIARAASAYAPVAIGRASEIRGDYKDGVLLAQIVLHAKPQPAMWAADR